MNTRNALNFSGGPGALPESVLREVQQAIVEVPDVGLSVLGISHRSDWFAAVVDELENNIRTLLGVGDNYHVLLLQGGATQQFSMVPMSLLPPDGAPADYLHTGVTGAARCCPRRAAKDRYGWAWSGETDGVRHLPSDEALALNESAPYLHYVSNETVEGLQFHRVLSHDNVLRVCDMSSDFLSRPVEAERFGLIYAHAQNNVGPAGVTVVVVRDDLLQGAPPDLPDFLDYRSHAGAHAILNTPPVFAIYVVLLVTRWLMQDIGGLAAMEVINRQKAKRLYVVLDESDGFYRGRAAERDRSFMNVAFNLADETLAPRFLAEAQAAGLSGLKGHRAIGGMRASLYNAVTLEAVEQLAGFMDRFRHARQSPVRSMSALGASGAR